MPIILIINVFAVFLISFEQCRHFYNRTDSQSEKGIRIQKEIRSRNSEKIIIQHSRKSFSFQKFERLRSKVKQPCESRLLGVRALKEQDVGGEGIRKWGAGGLGKSREDRG